MMNQFDFSIQNKPHDLNLLEREMDVLSSSSSGSDIEKTNCKGIETLLNYFFELARGAVKIVWIKRSSVPPSGIEGEKSSDKNVYYTAISSFLGRKEKELKEEFQKMKLIEEKLFSKFGSSTHLAIEAKEVKESKRVGGAYTIKTKRAKGDFENTLRNSSTSLQERIHLGNHFLQGLTNLHLVDFTHGDMKPENCLIYEKNGTSILKISDFGKTVELKDNETKFYSGNTRFAPPEGEQSKKGDVYSAALILIRNFEEEYLKDNTHSSLMDVNKDSFDIEAASEFRGIEKYVVENKAFLACNEGMSFDILKRRMNMRGLSSNEKEMQSQALHHYIDALHEKLSEDKRLTRYQADSFCTLLKLMTETDPQKRISAFEASEIYQNIFMENMIC